MHSQSRIKTLDILRFVAVLGVIGAHSYPLTNFDGYDPISVTVSSVWYAIGGSGVNLFFVLSGFLVSGLLFKEFKDTGGIDVKRFYIRRGFKIYPAFYFFLACSLGYDLIYQAVSRVPVSIPFDRYAASALFVQNYYEPTSMVWFHTWSLPIEEHFYLLLPILLVVLGATAKWRSDAFKHLPALFVVTAVLIAGNRMFLELTKDPSLAFAGYWTHLRIDELFFGVLLSYYYHFQPDKLGFLKRNPEKAFLVSVVLFGLAHLAMKWGLMAFSFSWTLMYLSFGTLLVVSLNSDRFGRFADTKFGRFAAFLGKYSYSIYLWHAPVKFTSIYLFDLKEPVPYLLFRMNVVYVVLSFVVGVAAAKLIETPFLKLRDRISERRGRPAAAPTGPVELPQQA